MYTVHEVEDGANDSFFASLGEKSDYQIKAAIKRVMEAWPFTSKCDYVEKIRIELQR